MTEAETVAANRRLFEKTLAEHRAVACDVLMTAVVSEWMNDGEEEVVRCLKCWADQGIALDDEFLLDRFDASCLADLDHEELAEDIATAIAALAE